MNFKAAKSIFRFRFVLIFVHLLFLQGRTFPRCDKSSIGNFSMLAPLRQAECASKPKTCPRHPKAVLLKKNSQK